ncbi:flavoprotein [Bacillus sp. SH8-8]|uniref:flavoprotein n=1 Tax=Bacillus sp. SH8-8 TaxID=2217830 RepID=UPI0034D5CAC8
MPKRILIGITGSIVTVGIHNYLMEIQKSYSCEINIILSNAVSKMLAPQSLNCFIIRGAYLHRPFLEWAASLAIITFYMIFFFIKSILTGIYETDINNKEQLNEKLKEKMSNTFILCFVAIGATTYKYNLPEDFVGWLSVIARFIILFAFLFGIQYLITVLAWKKSNKI